MNNYYLVLCIKQKLERRKLPERGNIMASSSKPEHTVRCGGIQLAIWSNETPKGNFQSITIDKSYKDKDGEWKRTKSFKPADLVKLQLGLNKVLEYLYLKPDVITPKSDVAGGTTPDF